MDSDTGERVFPLNHLRRRVVVVQLALCGDTCDPAVRCNANAGGGTSVDISSDGFEECVLQIC